MLNFFKKYYSQIIMVAVFFVAIIAIVYQSVYMVKLAKETSGELKQIQLDYAFVDSLFNRIPQLQRDAEYIEEVEGELSVLMPDDYDTKVQLFYLLEQMAEGTGNVDISLRVVETNNTKSKEADKKKAVIKPAIDRTIGIEITLIGSFDDMIYFMEKIETMEYFSNILSLQTRKVSNDSQNQALESKIHVVFYLQENN